MPAKKKSKKSPVGKKTPRTSKPAIKKKPSNAATKRTGAPSAKASARKPPAKKPAAQPASETGRPALQPARAAVAPPPPSRAEKFAIEAARCMDDDKCTEVTVLDVRGKNPMTDYLVIGSGTSDRQMRAVLHHIQDLGETLGYQAVRSTSDERATWLLADFMNVIVHLFEPNTRAHYDLEMMWGDTARIEWERPGTASRDRAGLNASVAN